MPLAAHRRHTNIRRTIQVALGNVVTLGGVTYPIYHDYSFADPSDARGGPNHQADRLWVETAFITQQAGRRLFSLVEANVFSRVGGEGEAGGDPFGVRIGGVADELEGIFSGLTADGNQLGYLEISDFADPANPVATGEHLVCQNSRGDFGLVEERKRFPTDSELRRITLTWRFRTIQDAAGAAAFYTS